MQTFYPIHTLERARAYETDILGDDTDRIRMAMENAGTAIGNALYADYREIRDWPEQARLLVLAGKGLNTGDAFVACRVLAGRIPGIRIRIIAANPVGEWHPLTTGALEELKAIAGERLEVEAVSAYLEDPGDAVDVVLDGLYGLGFVPPLREEPARLLEHVNARGDIQLRAAIDLPSGMGEETDPGCFVADFTYIPGVAKAPCFSASNRAFSGRVRFLEIEPFLEQPAAEDQRDFLAGPRFHAPVRRLRPARSDKRDFGHVLILAGSHRMPGAALMAASSSVRSGAGLVTVLSHSSVCSQLAGHLPEAMWYPLHGRPDREFDADTAHTVNQLAESAGGLLIGPGLLMDRNAAFVLSRIVRESRIPLLIDASALTQDIMSAVLGRPDSAGPVLITPHFGEYKRIIGLHEDPEDPATLRALAKKFRMTVLLKGNPTLITDGEQLVHVPAGGPVLARGGSGDILAGMALVQLAQDPAHPLEAATRAAVWHGAAADSLARERGSVAVRTTELLDHLAPSLRI